VDFTLKFAMVSYLNHTPCQHHGYEYYIICLLAIAQFFLDRYVTTEPV